MKRLSVLLIAAVLLIATTSVAFAAATMYVDTANHKTLNLRSHVDDKVIAQIPYRAAVQVKSFFQSDTCANVVYNGKEGWVYTRYLSWNRPSKSSTVNSGSVKSSSTKTSTTTSASSAASVFNGMKTVTQYEATVNPATPTSFVNLRWAPYKTAAIHGVRYSGDKVRVIAENKNWAQVIDDKTGESGFMLKKFLKKTDVAK